MPADRSIRVFVSSTFRDLRPERHHLATHVFPRLRALCTERDVLWTDVDLRWGIDTEEQSESRVVPICLGEIRRCEYFIGVLGERYGWTPDVLPAEVIAENPWLTGLARHSVTDLEITLGALLPGVHAAQALFYFRDPAVLGDRTDIPGDAAAEQTPERRARVEELKQRIRNSGHPVREGFRTVEELGRLVLADFERLIEERFPAMDLPGALAREQAAHAKLGRRWRESFAGRRVALAVLEAYRRDGGAPVAVTGDAGAGKSALVARWVQQVRKGGDPRPVVARYLGGTAASLDLAVLRRQLAEELAQVLSLDSTLDADADGRHMPWWLAQANARGGAVVALDAVDLVPEVDDTGSRWLPDRVPPDVRLVVSCGQEMAGHLRQRGWQVVELGAWTREERDELVSWFEARYAKRFAPKVRNDLLAAPGGASPQFLSVLLEELRLFGDADRLAETVRRYGAAPDVDALFSLVLARWEHDYDGSRPGLVRDTLCRLVCARGALHEAELLELLGSDGLPLPRARWEPFLLAMESSLEERWGRVSLGTGALRRAVERRYLAQAEARTEVHGAMADYFANQSPARRAVEQPWHEQHAGRAGALARTLVDPAVTVEAWRLRAAPAWADHWRALPSLDPVPTLRAGMAAASHRSVADRARMAEFASDVLVALGRPDAAVEFLLLAIDAAGPAASRRIVSAQANLGVVCLNGSRFAEAESLITAALSARERVLGAEHVMVAASVNDLAELRRRQGQAAIALPLHERAWRIRARLLGVSHPAIAESLNNLGCTYLDLGDVVRALTFFEQALAQRRELFGERYSLTADALNNLGEALRRLGRYGDAESHHRQALAVRERLFRSAHPAIAESLGNLALSIDKQGRLAEAFALYTRALATAEAGVGPDGLATLVHLNNLALARFRLGDIDEATELLRRAVAVAERWLGPDHPDAQRIRRNLITALGD